MKRLAIVVTHPIQYYAPVFQLLAKQAELMVFYTWGKTSLSKHDPGFGKTITWDIDLLTGYNYQWMENTAKDPGSHHFNGIVNPDVIKQIDAWQPDVILIYGWAYNSHVKVLRHYKKKIKVLFRGDSTLIDETAGIKSLLKTMFLKWLYKHVDIALYPGSSNKAYFKKYGLKEHQLVFAPHAVDNARFAASRLTEAAQIRYNLPIPEEETVILFAGKLESKKDPLLLVEAFLLLNKPGVHLLFVGNGPLEELLKKRAAGNVNIHFMDFQNQQAMPVIYQLCDVFCLPSRGPGETWGLAVNEAMACGKAIIVSDKVGCAADLVKNAENGYIFKHGNVTALYDTLLIISDKQKDELVRMGKRSAEIIEPWNFEVQANTIIKELK